MPTITRRKPPKSFASKRLLFVPSELSDIPAFLSSIGMEPQFIRCHQDKVAYVLHKIHEHQVFNKSSCGAQYVNLRHDTLAEVLGTRYVSLVLRLLLHAEIIECDGYFIQGSKSLGYRIAEAYRSKVVGVTISNPAVLAWKLDERNKEKRASSPQHSLLYGIDKNMRSLRIHRDEALQHIQLIYNQTEQFLQGQQSVLQVKSLKKRDYQNLLDLAASVGFAIAIS